MLEPSDALFASPVPTSSTKLALRPFLRRVYPDIPVELNRGAFASACTGEAATDAAEASASCSSGSAPPPPMFDVRSPAEYAHGHIPGALSLPLFNDDERAQVGTCFKNSGRFAAIQLGLALVGPKLSQMLQSVQTLSGAKPGDEVLVYCWRGGMRSSSVCWMLNLCGFQASSLDGGYRSFRRWCQALMKSVPKQPIKRGTDAAQSHDASAKAIAASISSVSGVNSTDRHLGHGGADEAAASGSFGNHFASARIAKENGEWAEAARCYKMAIDAGHPRADHCAMMASQCEAKLGQHEQALELLDGALRRIALSRETAGDVATASGRDGEARTVLRLQDLRAEALEQLGRYDEAAAALRLAASIEPSARRTKDLQRLADIEHATSRGSPPPTGETANEEAPLLPDEPPLARLRVLGGRTGSGKTSMLLALGALGEQVLDLEGLANHMGSAFGRVGQGDPQPTNEMYENVVALAWRRADPSRYLWVEHEGRHVGTCLVPDFVYESLRAPDLLVMLNVPRAARVRHLVNMYGCANEGGPDAAVLEELRSSVESLRKRRGGVATAEALEQLRSGDFAAVADAALEYYDRLYDSYAETSQRRHVLDFECAEAGLETEAQRVLTAVNESKWT